MWSNVNIVAKNTRGNIEEDGAGLPDVENMYNSLLDQLKDKEKITTKYKINKKIMKEIEVNQDTMKSLPQSTSKSIKENNPYIPNIRLYFVHLYVSPRHRSTHTCSLKSLYPGLSFFSRVPVNYVRDHQISCEINRIDGPF